VLRAIELRLVEMKPATVPASDTAMNAGKPDSISVPKRVSDWPAMAPDAIAPA
jgi:hypothetical protein